MATVLTLTGSASADATLTNPLASATGDTTADWSVTLDTASGGTIFAAARVSTDAQLSKANIENGTGDAVATSTDASPAAGSGNSGSFTGLTVDTTYIVDMFYRDSGDDETEIVSSASFTTGSLTASFTIGTTLTNPVVGESIGVWVVPNSETGFGVSGHEIYRNFRFQIDFGDGAATFAVNGTSVPGGSETARTIGAQTGSHIYWSTGSKTVTVRAWGPGNVLVAEETVAITVQDIDTIADVHIYHDPTGTFTGMPADNGSTIRRTQTWADVSGWSDLYSAGDYVIVHTARATTTSDGSITKLHGRAECIVVREFTDAGATGYSTWSSATQFDIRDDGAGRDRRVVFIGQRYVGTYDPIESTGGGGLFINIWPMDEASGYQNLHVTIARGQFSNFNNCFGSGFSNSDPDTGIWNIHFNDCTFADNFNYALLTGKGRIRCFAVGCHFLPNPFTTIGDPKANNSGFMADHAMGLRTHNALVISVAGCYAAGVGAWTGSPTEYDMQPPFRHHCMQPGMDRPTIAHYKTVTAGRHMVDHGSAGETQTAEPYVAFYSHNIHVGLRQFTSMFTTVVGSIVYQNSFVLIPDIYAEARSDKNSYIFRRVDSQQASGITYADSITIVAKRDSTGSGGQGGVGTWATSIQSNWTGAGVITSGLLVDTRNYSTGGVTPACTFSPGDLYKQVSSGTLEQHDGFRPVIDFGGNVRPVSGDVLKGCWQETVSSVDTPTAPSNTGAPLLKTMSQDGSSHVMYNDAWDNIDDNEWLGPIGQYMWKIQWFDGMTEVGESGTRYHEGTHGGGFTLDGRRGYVSLAGDDIVWADSSNSLSI